MYSVGPIDWQGDASLLFLVRHQHGWMEGRLTLRIHAGKTHSDGTVNGWAEDLV